MITLIVDLILIYLAIGLLVSIAYLMLFGEEYVAIMELDEYWNEFSKIERWVSLFISVLMFWPKFLKDIINL